MAMQYYGQLYVSVDGQLLAEATGVEVSDEDAGQPVQTIVKGLSGKTPGPHSTRISIRNVMPAAGVEVDFHNLAVANSFHDVKITRSDGASLTSTGWFMSPTGSSGVGETAALNVDFMGSPAEWT